MCVCVQNDDEMDSNENKERMHFDAAYRDIVVALHSGNALMAMRTIRAASFVEA